jgi:hypothetical protein
VSPPPTGTPSHASLMDIEPTTCCASPAATPTPDPARHVDFGLLYKRLLI